MKEMRVTIRLHKPIYDELKRMAKQKGETISVIMREAFNQYIGRGEGVIKEATGTGEESKQYGNH